MPFLQPEKVHVVHVGKWNPPEGSVTCPGFHLLMSQDPGPVFSDTHSSALSAVNTDILGTVFSLGLKNLVEITNNVSASLDYIVTGHFFPKPRPSASCCLISLL